MLTLKVFSIDQNDERQTTVFYGDSISHTERLIKASELKSFTDAKYVGSIINESSEQEFVSSHVVIYNADRTIKEILLILPKSDCFIMENGKTVDTFYSHFK
jgi:hypothetical protein